MSTQISVRLDDRLVAELDRLVKSGEASSRAQVVESALERELRRRLYEHDVQVLRALKDETDEFDALTTWAADHRPEID